MPGASTIDHVSALIADLGATLKNMATSDIVLPNHRDAFQQHTLAATTALDALTGLFHCPPIAVVPAVSAAAPSHTPSIASSPASVQRVVLPTAESPAIQRVDLPNTDGPAVIQRVVPTPHGTPEEHVVPHPVPIPVPAPPQLLLRLSPMPRPMTTSFWFRRRLLRRSTMSPTRVYDRREAALNHALAHFNRYPRQHSSHPHSPMCKVTISHTSPALSTSQH